MNRKALFRLASLPAACVAFGVTADALAQTGNATNGGVLYMQRIQPITVMGATNLYNCVDCHGDAVANRASWGTTEAAILARFNGIGNAGGSMTAYAAWSAQQRSDVAAYVSTSGVTPPPPPPAGTPPVPTATPDSLDFGTAAAGSSSTTQTITVRNVSTTANVSLTATAWLTNAGGDAAQFRLATPPSAGECANGMTLAPNATCSFRVYYSPVVNGSHRGNFAVNFANGVSQRLVVLQGTTSAPAQTLLLTPGTVMFTSAAVGATTAPTVVMLTNQSAAVMFAPQIVLPGGANPGDFVPMTPASGTPCGAGGSLAAGATCTLAFAFRPAATGNRAATWSVQFAGSPSRAIGLQGTATAAAPSPAPAPAPAPSSGGASGAAALAGLLAALLAGGRRRRTGD